MDWKWIGKSETEAGVIRMSLTACFKQSILREGTFKYETRRRNKIRISASITIGIGIVNRYPSAKTFEANLFSFYSRIEVIVHRSIELVGSEKGNKMCLIFESHTIFLSSFLRKESVLTSSFFLLFLYSSFLQGKCLYLRSKPEAVDIVSRE